MERLLQKMAAQLDALDEASLMSLWDKYADRTARFEPTAAWERDALVFCLLHAKHAKNQLFNWHVRSAHASGSRRREAGAVPPAPAGRKPCPILPFTPAPDEE